MDIFKEVSTYPSTSATAFAIPKGRVAPGKTCPPLTVPIKGSTNFKASNSSLAATGPDGSADILDAKSASSSTLRLNFCSCVDRITLSTDFTN